MTLNEAVSDAFGLSQYVRRELWPRGLAAVIDYSSANPLNPISGIIGDVRHVGMHPTMDDLQADDWQPCEVGGRPPDTDWRGVLSTRAGHVERTIARGDRCTVRLNDRVLDGDWRLVWLVPYSVWLSVVREQPTAWLAGGQALLRRMAVTANGVNMFFHLTEVETLHHDGAVRLYRLEVTTRDQALGELPENAGTDRQDETAT